MGSITASGLGSGIDIDSLVTRLVQAEGTPKKTALDLRETKLQTKLSAFGSLRSAASQLRTALNALSDLGRFQARSVTVGDKTLFSATAGGSSVPGGYAVEVVDLARAHKLRSADGAFASASTVVGTGTLTLALGTDSVDITIGDDNKTLAGVRDAINAAGGNPGITASIVNGSAGAQLVLTAADTGAANEIRVRQAGGDGGLAALTFDPGVATSLVEVQAAGDARIVVDGIEATSSTNVFSDVVTGVEITALAKSSAGATSALTIGYDRAASQRMVEDAVKAYNSVLGSLRALGKYDAATRTGGPLLGDSTLRDFTNSLRNEMGRPLTGQSTFGSLSDLGVSFALDGTLTVDSAKLQSALGSNFDAVGRAFADSTSGLAVRLDRLVDSYLDPGGLLDARTRGLQESIKDVGTSRTQLADRLTQTEARLRKQFSAMDALVGQLRNTGSFLSSQLATIKTS
jgi:flagellar hook-associated protein 2